MGKFTIQFIIGLFVSASVAHADLLTVGGSGMYPTIQEAVDAAVDGDEILVFPGSYQYTGDNEYAPVVDMSGKEIWLHSEHGPAATYIHGMNERRSILCNSGETNKTIIEGFTISHGFNSGKGGGIACMFSDPTIINCVFDRNGNGFDDKGNPLLTDRGGGLLIQGSDSVVDGCVFVSNAGVRGGGLHSYNNSNAIVKNCTFQLNEGDTGGGIYTSTAMTLTNCMFQTGMANHGGGIYIASASALVELTDCSFNDNTSERGGGMYIENCNPILTDCHFTSNLAASGGGIWCNSGDPILNTCHFTSNVAHLGSGGGMVCNNFSDAVLDSCIFISNEATFGGGFAGYAGSYLMLSNCEFHLNEAIHNEQGLGGGINFSGGNGGKNSTSLFLDNCLFESNFADYGAGLACSYSNEVEITNCTIVYNEANYTGGGIECDNLAIPVLTNTIVCDNSPDQINGTIDDQGGNTIGTGCGVPSSDIDGDGIVGVNDLLIVIEYWGTDEAHADLDGSGIVDVHDILIIVADWGPVDG